MAYRGSQWHVPVRESVRKKREGSNLVIGPPKGYGSGDIKVGDKVYIIPGCSMQDTEGGPGVAVEPEGPVWLAERGWIGVRRDDDEDVSNFQTKCLWKKR